MQSLPISDEVAAILDELATRFGTTAEALWSVVVYQATIHGACNIAWGAIALVIATVCAKQVPSAIRSLWDSEYESLDSFISSLRVFGGGLVAGVTFLLGTSWLTTGVQRLLNPEFFALRFILGALS